MSLPKTSPPRATVLLVAVAIIGFAVAGWRLFLKTRPAPGPRLAEIVQPNLDQAEPIVRGHIGEVQRRTQEVLSSPASTPLQRGRAFAEMGKTFLAYNYFGAAAGCFRNAAALEPGEFRWPYYLSAATEDDGQTAEATAPMATALKLMAGDMTATPADQHAALCRLGELALHLNKPAEAQGVFELAVKVNPRSVFGLVKLGQLASRAGDHQKAIALFFQAMPAQSSQPVVRRFLASEYRLIGDAPNAAKYTVPDDSHQTEVSIAFPDPLLSSVKELNRSGARQNRLGVHLLELGRYREAMGYFARGIQADSNSAGLRVNYSACLLALDRVAEGQRELEIARRIAPGAENIRAMLCSALAREPSTQKQALDEARAWRTEQPGKPVPLRTLSEVQLRLGLFAEALQTYKEWEALTPAEPGPRLGQARALAALGRGRESRQTLEAAADLFPGDPDVGTTLARLLVTYPDETVRDPAKALNLINRIIGATYSVTRAETLALALAETGQRDKALQVQREAIANCGDDGDVQVRRRLQGVLDSLEQRKPWREPWPFREQAPSGGNATRN